MKKLLTFFAAAALCAGSAVALPKAFYVKQGDKISKYNFGVAENLVFSNNGHTLSVVGYDETINLDEIDYISFSAPLGEALAPAAQKERLVQIGTEAYNTINVNDQADILKMVHDFFDDEEVYDTSDYKITYYSPAGYEFPLEYIGVHGEFSKVMESMKAIAKGNPAAVRMLKAKAINLYKIEDYNGIYTANTDSHKWEKTVCDDHLEMHFTGRENVPYVVSMTHSSDYTTWTTRDFNLRFPRVLSLTFARDSKQIATATITTTLNDRKSIDMKVEVLANNYNVVNTMNVVDDCITDNVKVTVKGTEFVTADTKVRGKNFVSYEEIYDAIDAAQDKWDDNEYDLISEGNPSRLVAMFNRAESNVDLLGKLQVRGIAYNGTKIYNELSKECEPYSDYIKDNVEYYSRGKVTKNDGNTIHVTSYDLDVLGSQVDMMNAHTDVGFYYDGDSKIQGYIAWEYGEDDEENWPDTPYYGEEGEPRTFAYTIVDGYLITVNREYEYTYDEATQSVGYVYGPWYMYGARYDEDGNYIEEVKTTVDEKALIYPELIYKHYYEITPILCFPDNTSFYMEDFFDEDSFTNLIDDYNEIIDTYLNITGQERDNDDY